MDIFPIWKSTFYETEADRVKFRILKWGVQEICRATAVRLPDDELLRIGLNKPCQNYLDSKIDLDATGVTISNAYAEFSLQIWNESNSQWFNAYEFAFVNDWSYETMHIGDGYSAPINGHAAPGQIISYSCICETTGKTMCYDDEKDFYFRITSGKNATIGDDGGNWIITYDTNREEVYYVVSTPTGEYTGWTSGGTLVVPIPANGDGTQKGWSVSFYDDVDGMKIGFATCVQDAHYQPEIDYSLDYLTIRPLQTGFVLIDDIASTDTPTTIYISRNNGANWTAVSTTSTYPGTKISVTAGNNILVKGYIDTNWTEPQEERGRKIHFIGGYYEDPVYGGEYHSGATFSLQGNVMSLVYGDDFVDKDTLESGGTFFGMFDGCSGLTSIENLVFSADNLSKKCYMNMFADCRGLMRTPSVLTAMNLAEGCYNQMFYNCSSIVLPIALPATTMATGCYGGMFAGCSSMNTAPALPADTLAPRCYASMFQNCDGLAEAPELPAMVLADGCYRSMFQNCDGLTETPKLPATALTDNCYESMFSGCRFITTANELLADTMANECCMHMFQGCSALTRIECLATDVSASDCTYRWVYGVSTTGTFVKNHSMTGWTTGYDGIPSGWTIEDA